MAATVDPSFVKNPDPWMQRSHAACDEMISRGNMVAKQIRSELKQLEGILNRFTPDDEVQPVNVGRRSSGRYALQMQKERQLSLGGSLPHDASVPPPPYVPSLEPGLDDFSMDDFNWQDGLSAEQIMSFAETMDLSALDWLSVGTVQSQ